MERTPKRKLTMKDKFKASKRLKLEADSSPRVCFDTDGPGDGLSANTRTPKARRPLLPVDGQSVRYIEKENGPNVYLTKLEKYVDWK